MRRRPISQYWCVSLRTGVTDNVISKKVSVQSPAEWVMTSMGLAPSREWNPFHARRASGPRQAMKTAGLIQRSIGNQRYSTQHSATTTVSVEQDLLRLNPD